MRHVLLVAALLAAVGIVPAHAGPPATAQFTPPPAATETCVAVETRIVQVPAAAFDRWCGQGRLGEGDTKFLTDAQLRTLMEVVQGEGHGTVLAAPKVTVLDGQTAVVNIGEKQQVTRRVTIGEVNGQMTAVPELAAVDVGHSLSLAAHVSADRTKVCLIAQYRHVELAPNPAKVAATSWVTPVFEGGSQGVPVPVTQMFDIPKVEGRCIEKTVVVPDGRHVVIVGSKRSTTHKVVEKVPVLGDLPVLGELFTDTRCEQVSERTVLILTPRVIQEVEPAAVAPAPRPMDPPVLSRLNAQVEMPRLSRLAPAAAAVEPVPVPVVPAAGWEPMPTPRPLPVPPPAAVPQPMPAPRALPPMTPPQPMPMTWGDAGWSARCVEYMMCNLAEQQPQVLVQAFVMKAPAGFMADAGFEPDVQGPVSVCYLTPREATMINVAVRRGKEKGCLDILSRPAIQLANNQTGFVQVGQQYPYTAGNNTAQPAIEYTHVGFTMRLTPRVMPDGTVEMRVEPQVTTVSPTAIDLGNGVLQPAFNCQTVHTTVTAKDGQTVLLTGLKEMPPCGPLTAWAMRMCGCEPQGCEYVITLTPHIVRPNPPVLPAGHWSK